MAEEAEGSGQVQARPEGENLEGAGRIRSSLFGADCLLAAWGTRRRSASEGQVSFALAVLALVLVFYYVALELKGVAGHDI